MLNAATSSWDSSAVTSCDTTTGRDERGGTRRGTGRGASRQRRRAMRERRGVARDAREARGEEIRERVSPERRPRVPIRNPGGRSHLDDFIVERVLPRLLRRAHVHERVQDVVQHDGGLVQEAAVPPRVPRVVPHDDASPQHRLERPRCTAAAASGACDAPERSLDAREAFDRTDPRAFASDWLRSRDRVSLRRALRARARAELVKHPSRLSFPSTPAAGEHDSRFDT